MRPVDPRLPAELPGFRGYLTSLGVLGALTAGAILVQAELLAGLLAHAAGQRAPGTLAGTVALLAAAVLGRAVLVWAGGLVATRFTARACAILRNRVLRRAPGAGIGEGQAATLATRGVDGLSGYLAEYLPKLVASAIIPVAVVARLATADLVAALTIACTLPLIPVFAALVGAHTRARTQRQWRLLTRLGGHFLDMVAGLPTLAVFGRAKAQAVTIRGMAERHASATMRTLRVAFLSALVLELVATLSVALVAVPVGLRLLEGGVTAHTALLVLLLAPEAYLPLRAAGATFHASAEGLAALRDVRDLPEPRPLGNRRAAPDPRRAVIRLEQVTVWYPGAERPALSDVDLEIAPGERLAVTGPSGSGKSTLLAVLLGLVQPTSGRVLVGGVDLGELEPDSWWGHIAWVPQRPTLFAGTLAHNVTLGLPADADALRAATRDAELAGLPGGYRLGDRGLGLSSGQRQRVGLARALLRRDAGLLLLDEPTAHLDTESEEAILRTTARLLGDRTAVLVAHRPQTAALATRVLRLREGAPCPVAV